jgi:hypothetical protein
MLPITRIKQILYYVRIRRVGHAVVQLRNYATRYKVANSRPDEVNDFFSIFIILPAALGPGVYSASKRNEY